MSKMTFICENSGSSVEIHEARRIEQDHKNWYVWAGRPEWGPAALKPQIISKWAGTVRILEDGHEIRRYEPPKYELIVGR